jgi:hypothetical protein
MPSLNFKQRFVIPIENGRKRQTIRKMRKRPFRTDDTLYLFTGMRTAKCRRLGTHRCVGAHHITITHDRIEVDGRILTPAETIELVQADGFASSEEFLDFFRREHDLPLVGQLIRW